MEETIHPGKILFDRYQVIEKIGERGMGKVYKVFDIPKKFKAVILRFYHLGSCTLDISVNNIDYAKDFTPDSSGFFYDTFAITNHTKIGINQIAIQGKYTRKEKQYWLKTLEIIVKY